MSENPYNIYNQYGYTCAACGMWVPAGTYHYSCTPYSYTPTIHFILQGVLERIAVALEKIQARADKLAEEAAPCSCDPARNGKTVHADGRVTCNKCGKERV